MKARKGISKPEKLGTTKDDDDKLLITGQQIYIQSGFIGRLHTCTNPHSCPFRLGFHKKRADYIYHMCCSEVVMCIKTMVHSHTK